MLLEAYQHWRPNMGHFIKDTMLSEWAETSSVQSSSFFKATRNMLMESSLSMDSVLMERFLWITARVLSLFCVGSGYWAATQEELAGPPRRGSWSYEEVTQQPGEPLGVAGLFLSPAPAYCVRLPVWSSIAASLCVSQCSGYKMVEKTPLYTTAVFVKVKRATFARNSSWYLKGACGQTDSRSENGLSRGRGYDISAVTHHGPLTSPGHKRQAGAFPVLWESSQQCNHRMSSQKARHRLWARCQCERSHQSVILHYGCSCLSGINYSLNCAVTASPQFLGLD